MKYETILFDLDGTLLNTLEDLQDSVNYALAQKGFPTHSLENIRQFVGNGIRNLMILATPEGENNPLFQETFSLFQAYYLTHNQIKTKPYPGIMEMLAQIQKHNIPMAIVTNKNQPSVDVLKKDMFQGIIPIAIGDNGTRPRKPDVAPVEEALRQLHPMVTEDIRSKTLYVGDSEVDAATAQNAGLDCALCTWGFRPASLLKTLPHVALLEKPEDIFSIL